MTNDIALPAAYLPVIDRLVAEAAQNNGQLLESEAHAAFRLASAAARKVAVAVDDEDDEDEEGEEEDELLEDGVGGHLTVSRTAREIAAFLAALSTAGVEIIDEFVAAELDRIQAKILAVAAADAVDGESLDSYSQWKREATHHRILTRTEEIELTSRLAISRKAQETLTASGKRLLERFEEARELLRYMEEASADLGPAAAEVLTEQHHAAEALAFEHARVCAERDEAKRESRRLEAEFLSYNFRLVFFHAVRIHEQSRKRTDIMDLVSQGNEGMVIAVRKFDPSLGFKFSTFATWHIRQKISEFSYEQGSSLKVPVHRHRDVRKIKEFRRRYFDEHGELPDIETIAAAAWNRPRSPKKVLEILAAEQLSATASLDKPISDENDAATIGDLIADSNALSPEDIIVNEAMRVVLLSAMERCLNPRERRVIQLRFGLYDGHQEKRTLEQIGARMNITRERVRQIESRALDKLFGDLEIQELRGLPNPRRTPTPAMKPAPRPAGRSTAIKGLLTSPLIARTAS